MSKHWNLWFWISLDIGDWSLVVLYKQYITLLFKPKECPENTQENAFDQSGGD